ncbi:AAA family ATPase [Rickenella mellea]|uniref:AAA family ATPase n=1 Tax=Rickenella mellea TaxID=50990 RepID=A0A4Y7PVZ9_9AGAM|nr:AAA family ATPase [Rickenella mellea]
MAETSLSSKSFFVHQEDFVQFSASRRHTRRIYIHPDILKSSKICTGDVLALTALDFPRTNAAFAVGLAWASLDAQPDTIYASSSHIISANVQEGDKVRLFPLSMTKLPPGLPSPQHIRSAGIIEVRGDDSRDGRTSINLLRPDWLPLLLRETLIDLKYVHAAQRFEVQIQGCSRRFTIVSVSRGHDPVTSDETADQLGSLSIDARPVLWTATWDTQVVLQPGNGESEKNAKPLTDESGVNVEHSSELEGYVSVGGLDKQIQQVRDLIDIPLTRPDLLRHFGLKPPKGILLHGPPGTGKTHLARAIVASTKSSVIVINGSELSSVYHGETEAKLRDVFKEARHKSPCIVVLDEVDALCPRREDGAGGEVERRVVATLLTILDGMDHGKEGEDPARVVVIGTTNRPNAIDPALRRPGRFDREIEIGIPDALARLSILKVLLAKTPNDISEDDLRAVAFRTHGYVGADLSAVVREAGTIAIKRWISNAPANQVLGTSSSGNTGDLSDMLLTLADLESGLSSVQPSAMREVFIETPQVRWSDIGGQQYVKQKLKECIEWPLLHPEAFERLGVKPPKGVLLYGPPGCSKTLTAKALATESGINFIAVKGPELLNKFVGESERAIREIFRKARAASPSIIFFDEIDALGTSRSEGRGNSSHEGVITTLLNEMDGVQELVGVTVVAATNRPDVIDTALMRPGRLDRILYVGPPEYQGRVDILKIRTSKMAVDPNIDLEELASLTDGCSGAEISALCQDAALWTMHDNMDAPYVPHAAFVAAAKAVRRQITPETIRRFETWRETSGLPSA